MGLGQFSLSLTVKDIEASLRFYQSLGFELLDGCGSVADKWLILKNGNTMIGLFQDMFDKNILTFNPQDVRGIEQALKAQGIVIDKASEGDSGPGHIMLRDPDGNVIMLDQF